MKARDPDYEVEFNNDPFKMKILVAATWLMGEEWMKASGVDLDNSSLLDLRFFVTPIKESSPRSRLIRVACHKLVDSLKIPVCGTINLIF